MRSGQSTSHLPEMTNSFGVYVHIPYCVHRCSYCDFFSSTQYQDSSFDRLFQALTTEWISAVGWLEERGRRPPPLRSLFLGGGTPSLSPLPPLTALLRRILDYGGTPQTEVTLEANPETVTAERIAGWRAAGVNRVSLGAQSFEPDLLKLLERQATAESIERAVERLQAGGVEHYSLDLIFGIPTQNRDRMIRDIDRAIGLNPEHISFYSLTLKPGHSLYSRLPSDDEAADLYEAGVEHLARNGYQRYEISNFARAGKESQHNRLYWDGGDFLGIGPSAASRFFWDGKFYHRKQVADLKRYLEVEPFPAPGWESTSESQTILEATFLELRKAEGVDVRRFAERYGYDLTGAKKFSQFVANDLLVQEGNRLRLTPKGFLLADGLTSSLVDVT